MSANKTFGLEAAGGAAARLFVCTFGLLCLTGCDNDEPEEITLQVGPEEIFRFGASSGFAHYYELSGQDDMLRIVLASYSLGCQEYVPPKPGEVFVTITLRAPSPEAIEAGTYYWEGVKISEDGGAEETEDEVPPKPSALPFVRLSQDAQALPPGGGLKLTKFEPETFGLVEGELGFRDAAPGQAATTALMGRFSLRLCHLELDPARRAPPKKE